MKTQSIKINNLNYHLTCWGNIKKPKLFLIHGWMDIGASFHFMCESLQDSFYCIAPDLRGFGKTSHKKDPLGYFFFEYLADLHQLFNEFSPEEPVRCLGHSMGGNILSLYAGTFPERVSHFVNMEGFGIEDMPPQLGPKRLKNWIVSLSRQPKSSVYQSFESLAKKLIDANPALTIKQASFLAKHLGHKVKDGIQIASDPKHKLPHPHLHQLINVSPFWQHITAKTLLMMGDETKWGDWLGKGVPIQRELNRRFKYFPKNAQKTVVEQCGHMIHLEKPKQAANIVQRFLLS